MVESMCVNLTGTVFSYFMYDNLRHFDANQEGFIIGDVTINKQRLITDDRELVKIQRNINIHSMMPCPTLGYFYNSNGSLNLTKIKEVLEDNQSKVVAWYRFSRTNSFRLTLRQKILHKNLAKYFNPNNKEHFLTCLLNAKKKPGSHSTIVFSQTFVRYHNNKVQPVLLNIVKLSNKFDEYKKHETCPPYLKDVLESIKDHSTMSGYKLVSTVDNAMQEQITKLLAELTESEMKVYALEKDVREMRQSLARLYNSGFFSEATESSTSTANVNKRSIEEYDGFDSSFEEQKSDECEEKTMSHGEATATEELVIITHEKNDDVEMEFALIPNDKQTLPIEEVMLNAFDMVLISEDGANTSFLDENDTMGEDSKMDISTETESDANSPDSFPINDVTDEIMGTNMDTNMGTNRGSKVGTNYIMIHQEGKLLIAYQDYEEGEEEDQITVKKNQTTLEEESQTTVEGDKITVEAAVEQVKHTELNGKDKREPQAKMEIQNETNVVNKVTTEGKPQVEAKPPTKEMNGKNKKDVQDNNKPLVRVVSKERLLKKDGLDVNQDKQNGKGKKASQELKQVLKPEDKQGTFKMSDSKEEVDNISTPITKCDVNKESEVNSPTKTGFSKAVTNS